MNKEKEVLVGTEISLPNNIHTRFSIDSNTSSLEIKGSPLHFSIYWEVSINCSKNVLDSAYNALISYNIKIYKTYTQSLLFFIFFILNPQ